MSEDIFDVIIVGAGMAGSAAALTAARAGLETLAVERGNFPGAKNMTGGRLYAHSLERLIPGFAEEAPVERCVTRERISFLTETDAVTMEYAAPRSADPAARSYTVLRSKFDQWLWSKAEEAGAQLVPGVRVDELIVREGRVRGIRAGEDELLANVVILADGVNSTLGAGLGMTARTEPRTCAVGVKEVLELSPQQMRDRFCCEDGNGMAWLFAGMPSNGHMGGAFLYTNEDTVSLGLVFGLHGIADNPVSVPRMLEDFKRHPAVAPLVEGGRLVEYSAHVVPEGGLGMMPPLVRDGALIAGDAAGMCLNVGYTVRGMDLAVAAGECAARAAVEAKEKGDFSAAGLAGYERMLRESFVLKDMELYRGLPSVLDNPRIFTAYPQMAADLMRSLFAVSGPSERLRSRLWSRAREAGIMNLIGDGIRIMGAI